MDLIPLITLAKDNITATILVVFLVLAGSAGVVKLVISRKSEDVSIKIGKIKGNNNSIAGRDVSKN
ncbi:hypothetical protein N9C35_03400 [Flavobacteriaceae bacterium]|nr:hypothetical protein [Flavobacteriaceae bacterium]